LRSGQFHGANVLLITIDTLRADRLGAYGNPNGLTPVLDRLAAHGVRYAHATSHVPMTLPAHTTILTGLTPPRSGVRNNTTFRLDDRVPTLATYLKRQGYRTGAFVGAFVLDARFGLAHDFDLYDDRLPHAERAAFLVAARRGADVVGAAGRWIIDAQIPDPGPRAARPWFAWVHLFDPHAPYDAPPEFRAGRSPYDAAVAYADAMVGRLLDQLQSAHQLEHTLVVVTADHGESLGEHGETTHGLFAYEATIHVPLILNGASVPASVVDAPVAHADIAPTILDLVGADVPAGLDGRTLVQPPPPDRSIYFEALDANLTRGWAPLTGVVQNRWKYIDLPEPELYDLSSDPGELRNLASRGDRVERLRRSLQELNSAPPGSAPVAPVDAEARGRLRSLGYVGGAASPVARSPTVADDPKRLVRLNEQFNSALTAFDEGRRAEALSMLNAVLEARPDFASARASAATVLLSLGRGHDAVRLLQAAPPEQRDSPELLGKLGAALRQTGELPAAAAALEQARRAGGGGISLLEDLAVTYAALGRLSEARTLFDELTALEPSAATVWYNRGLFELQSGDPGAAAQALRRAVEREPGTATHGRRLGRRSSRATRRPRSTPGAARRRSFPATTICCSTSACCQHRAAIRPTPFRTCAGSSTKRPGTATGRT
jgi:arylsulfatase A-like enzyme/Flp pilus assembly protein TadD